MLVRIDKNSPDMQKMKNLVTDWPADRLAMVAICIVACAATYYFATYAIEASLLDGEYHPWGYDSF